MSQLDPFTHNSIALRILLSLCQAQQGQPCVEQTVVCTWLGYMGLHHLSPSVKTRQCLLAPFKSLEIFFPLLPPSKEIKRTEVEEDRHKGVGMGGKVTSALSVSNW